MMYFWLVMLVISTLVALVSVTLGATAFLKLGRYEPMIFLPYVFLVIAAACLWAALISYANFKAEWADQHPAAVIDSPVTSGKVIT